MRVAESTDRGMGTGDRGEQPAADGAHGSETAAQLGFKLRHIGAVGIGASEPGVPIVAHGIDGRGDVRVAATADGRGDGKREAGRRFVAAVIVHAHVDIVAGFALPATGQIDFVGVGAVHRRVIGQVVSRLMAAASLAATVSAVSAAATAICTR